MCTFLESSYDFIKLSPEEKEDMRHGKMVTQMHGRKKRQRGQEALWKNSQTSSLKRRTPPHPTPPRPSRSQQSWDLEACLIGGQDLDLLGDGVMEDCKRPVHFYWWRGEEIIVHGHRKGRVDAVRYQINDTPHNQIRMSKQLPEFVPLDYSVPIEIPVMNCKPDKLPLFKRQYENAIFIGSRTADPYCYGHTQFHLLPEKLNRERLLRQNCADQIEVVYRANAIASLFAWTGAQAMYQGFWSEADVTRPFVSQAVITDGRYFSFFCYQLNTLALTAQADQNNSRKNICWGTQSKPLYETIEDNDVKGFNDDVLLQIVHFLLNRPKEDKSPLLEK
uniref:Mitochondrial ribosomal protein S30 n=2 Tax=Myotis myotis TaxID=51298 RepID=A0A7J7Y157_MYOMY|nr:mitochondrial ribosomal protein S30 [Myotis myotis]